MKNFDLSELGVKELEKCKLIEVNGGQLQPSPNPWWSLVSTIVQAAVIVLDAAADAYIDYSKKTGGQYVIHHAV